MQTITVIGLLFSLQASLNELFRENAKK